MIHGHYISVIFPVLDAQDHIRKALEELPESVDDVIVMDRGSADHTPQVAREWGARVFFEPGQGYGAACQGGMAQLKHPDVVVFLSGDCTEHLEDIDRLVEPIARNEADLVVGSRVLGGAEVGALTAPERYANQLGRPFLRWIWKVRVTDLSLFRAIRHTTLLEMQMEDLDTGWALEMQIKAAKLGFRWKELPVQCRKRPGELGAVEKIKGIALATTKTLFTVLLHALSRKKKEEPIAGE